MEMEGAENPAEMMDMAMADEMQPMMENEPEDKPVSEKPTSEKPVAAAVVAAPV
jgi:hypothetical protein